MIRTYDVAFEGRTVCVDAEVDLPRVLVHSIREHGETVPRTYAADGDAPGPDGKVSTVALGQWTPNRRRALFEAVRHAERARLSARQPS